MPFSQADIRNPLRCLIRLKIRYFTYIITQGGKGIQVKAYWSRGSVYSTLSNITQARIQEDYYDQTIPQIIFSV